MNAETTLALEAWLNRGGSSKGYRLDYSRPMGGDADADQHLAWWRAAQVDAVLSELASTVYLRSLLEDLVRYCASGGHPSRYLRIPAATANQRLAECQWSQITRMVGKRLETGTGRPQYRVLEAA